MASLDGFNANEVDPNVAFEPVVAARTWRFPTWDRFELPVPFARVQIAYGEPVQVPRVVNAEGLAALQREMAGRLEALRAEARAALDRPGR